MKVRWIGVALMALLILGSVSLASANSAFVPIDPDAFAPVTETVVVQPEPIGGSMDAFVQYNEPQDPYLDGQTNDTGYPADEAKPAATKKPVQDQGIITLESRRVFGGDLTYLIDNVEYTVNWSAGVAYVEDASKLGPLRHVWVYAEDESAEVTSFDYSYDPSEGGDVTFLTLTLTLTVNNEDHLFREVFRVTPDGQGAKAQPTL